MKKIIYFFSIALLLNSVNAFSQGCIAVRHMASATGNPNSPASMMKGGQFQFTASYRYLHSFRHFVGTVEQKERIENGTQVINTSHAFDFGLSYAVNPRLSFSLNLPFLDNDRSSLYEHYGNSKEANPDQKRFHTYSKGVGDMRVSATYWLLNPATHLKGNLAIGVGIKAPTGDANVQGDFHKLDKNKKEYIQRKALDQSMQLGDSGWGYSIEIQGYQSVFKNASVYYNGFYMFSPKTVNAATGYSVPDQFAGRAGLSYSILPKQGISFALGGRVEGLPAIDRIGNSQGNRRPGYIVSVEPSVILNTHHHSFIFGVPYAVVRNRIKSWSDMQDPQGLKHGDAAFADYLITATYAYRF
ncbi:hypothetical protein [Emticicia sp. 17c]|uniref:hypothetical protein n=1 Tax=Emticicia sp. 17c TaxID=3127704 RepID=UPI00301C2A9C